MNDPLAARPAAALSRRRLLAGAGLATGAVAAGPLLSACTGSGDPAAPVASGGGAETGTVQWWDQFRPLTATFDSKLFRPFEAAHPGVTIERREMDGPALGEALQLARRSNQSPDVHSLAGLDGTPAALVANGWFQPIDDFVDVAALPIADQLLEGIHRFDGRLYSLPVFSGRWHDAVPWSNRTLLERAGVDPAADPGSWDDFRATMRQLRDGLPDGASALVVPSKVPSYLQQLVERLAMSAGAVGAVDPSTGEYAYASQPYLDAMELLVSLQADGVVHPASASMDTRDARARWAAGEAAVYLWGPWFIGGLKVNEPEAIEQGVGVWHIPTPDGGAPVIYSPPPGGTFWVSAQARLPRLGAQVMAAMLEPEFMRTLAGAMDQPPVLDELVAEADVEEAYRTNIEYMASDVRTAPQPQVRNPDVARVQAEMRDVHPNLGEIAQAVLTGSTSDYASALRTLSDQLTAERDRAVEAVSGDGAAVGVEDWVFSDWQPGQDWTP
ncbi:extracellular solute-binding protein [Auraticoccus sp. F435]|uniref:Extracellular solute-binding protein n=1 Tax=Auraticoccus cholistanensis TaxID=2656650 RepID=A0A6A9UVM9_9ACTN|nr:extracellular solute-binding protein [Auraticoccus cholistanensis]MVA75267.1 extracellular solute-binding protein [Auraticoccus cholistanensis]